MGYLKSTDFSGVTVEDAERRISLLSDEIDANEQENRDMQDEIDALYTHIDSLKAKE